MEAHPNQLEISIEVARGGFVKWRPDGSIDFVSFLPCPFSYGSVLGRMADDGDPEDALVIGATPERGERITLPVWGRVQFLDGGVVDDKWICGPMAPSVQEQLLISRFFRWYAVGKRILNRLRGVEGSTRFSAIELWDASSG